MDTTSSGRDRKSLRIGIIGAGFAGIGLAARLLQAGYSNIVIFERAPSLGGTWRDNTYPGAACDVPSHLYSFSFAPKSDWHNRYARQYEIHSYMQDLASRFGVEPLLRCGRSVEQAVFNDVDGTWLVTTSRAERETFDVLVTAVGQLSVPSVPKFAGLERFDRPTFHSAAWDHSVPLAGKRIAVVGSAASATQIVPELAKVASRVIVYQRTPNWIIPRWDRPYGAIDRALCRYVPLYRKMVRACIYLRQEALFQALRTGSALNRTMQRVSRWHIRRQVRDAILRDKLTPRYTFGCKRVLLSDDYLPSFNLPTVELVTERIAGFEPGAIRTMDGTCRPCDAVVFATGFDTRNTLSGIDIRGCDGARLSDCWSHGPAAYLGVAVPKFPNFFLLYGPNTNLGHNSILFMFECQFDFIMQCLDRLVARGVMALEVSAEACASYNRDLQAKLAGSVWVTGCGNWYGDGERITANWPGSTIRYRYETRHVNFHHFVEHRFGSDAIAARSLSELTQTR
jgi:cation diffusion facilitator CzcD-associated flavoprotein CzcO